MCTVGIDDDTSIVNGKNLQGRYVVTLDNSLPERGLSLSLCQDSTLLESFHMIDSTKLCLPLLYLHEVLRNKISHCMPS